MKLKDKSKLTGKELCEIEGILFPLMMKRDNLLASLNPNDKESQSKIAETGMSLINGLIIDHGIEIVKLCYVDDNGNEIKEVNFPFRMKLLEDMEKITAFIFEEKSEGKSEKTPIKIKR